MYWVLPVTLIIFIGLDFLINKKTKESPKYLPDFKIWGMGFILGLTIFLFDFLNPLKEILLAKKDIPLNKTGIAMENISILDCKVSAVELIRQIAVLLFFLAVLAIILSAIVKIIKDEW